ncbi:hypothetical protein [Streptomyces alboniger]|uniref:Uncharacterized protein n=1 Tax=Streptomyces alboniger TaxID=132473 RepID=A0A5J6HMG0_STRAD|nr:hypothetical protein [Streptomyces alboniger]QEV20402.1 hypothetical protein CP975_25265 [Streptomyces alboniger]
MGTKTDDAAGAKGAAGTEAEVEVETGEVTEVEIEEVTEADEVTDADAETGIDADAEAVASAGSTGVGQGAAAVVSAALGVIGLSGGWLGTIAGARADIMGRLETRQSASVSDQLQATYGDSWQATALIAGIFALSALVVGFVVLVRPAFGAPGKDQAPWIKSVAWAGVALGVIGLILAVAKYSDLLLGLPSAPS